MISQQSKYRRQGFIKGMQKTNYLAGIGIASSPGICGKANELSEISGFNSTSLYFMERLAKPLSIDMANGKRNPFISLYELMVTCI